ncbi:MAG: DUF4405 domain-containing protein [Treponema sp.]|nr:DUF4405 domain-containing protein [Treponema sp.]
MNKINRMRLPIDIMMTLVSIVLMGGNYLFPADIVHEILGVALFVLWGVHIALNRRWYGAIFKGKYNPYRIMQTVINCGILICTILLMISGIILSNHIFTFLNIQGGLGFARIAHLLASHWYYVFMSLHLGMHVEMIANKIRLSRTQQECHFRALTRESSDKAKAIAAKVLLVLVCVYGIYAFIVRGVGKYMFLRQQFFFLDLEKGYLLFALDYLSILVLIATASHWLGKALRAWSSGRKESCRHYISS